MQGQSERVYDTKPVNPIDVMETLFRSHQWTFERTANHGLSLRTHGAWCNYHIFCATEHSQHLFYLTCTYDMRIPEPRRKELYHLLALINKEIWMGHFDLCSVDGAPTYRHAMPIRGVKRFSLEQMEDFVDRALTECERFHPIFQGCLFGHLPPEQVISMSKIECHGIA